MIFKKNGKANQKFPKKTEVKNKETNNSDKKTTTQTSKTNKSKWNSRCGDLLPQ